MRGRSDIEIAATLPSLDELLSDVEKPAEDDEDEED
jgi:hypothetical protein